jgi:hypothetical protein
MGNPAVNGNCIYAAPSFTIEMTGLLLRRYNVIEEPVLSKETEYASEN